MLAPFPSAQMEAYPISTYVNSPRNDGPQCVAPLQEAGQGELWDG